MLPICNLKSLATSSQLDQHWRHFLLIPGDFPGLPPCEGTALVLSFSWSISAAQILPGWVWARRWTVWQCAEDPRTGSLGLECLLWLGYPLCSVQGFLCVPCPGGQRGTCSQIFQRRENGSPCLPIHSCSNKTLTSRAEECILTVLALEGCLSLLSIPAPFGAAGGRAACREGEVLSGLSGAAAAGVSCQHPQGAGREGGCPDYQLFNTLPPPLPRIQPQQGEISLQE